jgi:superfamily II DNA or RNA helicase
MYLTRNAVPKLPTFKLKLPYAGEKKGSYQVKQPLLGFPKMPLSLQLRGYQRQAVTSWFANHGRGTLKMATGSGKTITALAIACELYQQIGLQVKRQNVFGDQPGENLDSRIIEVKIRLNPEDSKKVSGLTNLQVQTAIKL